MSTILLVEDNEMNRDMVSRRLARHGFQVVCATNGREGVELAHRQDVALILMDLSLPVMDGWEALRRVKADPSTGQIPVIALTAHALASDRDHALRMGFDGYETKPIDFPHLIAKMNALIHKRPQGTEERAPGAMEGE